MQSVRRLTGLALAVLSLACVHGAYAQSTETKSSETKAPEAIQKQSPELYETIYLTKATQQNEANEILNALRNMLPRSKVYFVSAQGALTLRGSAEDIQLAKRIVSELDRAQQSYRLTFNFTEKDGGKSTATQQYALILLSGEKTEFKAGSRVPLVTGSYEAGSSTAKNQVQYVDIGLSIQASLDASAEGLRLRSKIERSSIAEEKTVVGGEDPVIRQTMLEGSSILMPGKPILLGSLDIPGGTRRYEIEVLAEPVK
jgi:type II secretory pathway component GspD/PulD (secretin)